GIPPLLGFAAKEEVYASALGVTGAAEQTVLAAAMVAMAALTLLAAAVVVVGPFFAPRSGGPESHEGDSAGLWLPALALAGVGAALGLAAAWTGETLVAPAALAMTGEDAEAGLHALPVPG